MTLENKQTTVVYFSKKHPYQASYQFDADSQLCALLCIFIYLFLLFQLYFNSVNIKTYSNEPEGEGENSSQSQSQRMFILQWLVMRVVTLKNITPRPNVCRCVPGFIKGRSGP